MIGSLAVFLNGTTCVELEILVKIECGGCFKTMALNALQLTDLREHSLFVGSVEDSIYTDSASTLDEIFNDYDLECTGWRLVWK
jgi:hypothetical protein